MKSLFFVFRIHTTPIFTVIRSRNKNIIENYLNNAFTYSSGSVGVIRGIKIPNINTPNKENLDKYILFYLIMSIKIWYGNWIIILQIFYYQV